MWTITGPFDDPEGQESTYLFCVLISIFNASLESKLLKTGRSYSLGRKDQDLIVPNKKVSHHHCEFLVGKWSIEEMV
jgi:hypothetical protein